MTLSEHFLALHRPGAPLVMPNPWDAGTARILAAQGFAALATTSGGYAATLGRLDGGVTRDEAIAHAAAISAAVDVPVSADLENGFADDGAGVAQTIALACGAGLAGCSIEDWDGSRLYDRDAAAERVAAAVAAAGGRLVITARAENHIRGNPDLADTIARLQAYEEAGADVLYAPGLTEPEEIRSVVESVSRPVNVLALPGAPSVPVLASLGVARVSIGGALAYAMIGALVRAASELRDAGTYGYTDDVAAGVAAARAAFTAPG